MKSSTAVPIILLSLAWRAAFAQSAYPCKAGDYVEGWNVDWYAATISEVGSGDHAGYCLLKWDKFAVPTWIKATNIRAAKGASSNGTASASKTPPATRYTCGVFLNSAFTFTQSVTLKDDGTYQSTSGAAGRYRFDAASAQVTFEGGALNDVFGRYEPDNKGIIRLTSKGDAGKSTSSQNWRSQVCSPQK